MSRPYDGLFKITIADPQCLPHVGSEESAGLDLRIYLGSKSTDVMSVLPPGEKKTFRTGVAVQIPRGYVGLAIPRSSTGSKLDCMLANTVGVIDSDYRGEIQVVLRNMGKESVTLENYQRICQLVLVPYWTPSSFEVVEELDSTERGTAGWGSTGKV